MREWIALGSFGTALALASCGGSIAVAPPSPSPTIDVCQQNPTLCAVQSDAAAPTPTPNTLEGPVGTPFTDTDSSQNIMTVTLTAVQDPAKSTSVYLQPDNGKRFVAAKFTIVGTSGTFADDANNDASVVGSDSQTYTADFDPVRGCTNFNSGEFSVASGQTSVGCVVFQIPNGVKVAQVEWGAAFGAAPAIWDVG
ncbi:MAG TPA: DUF4352 domain-containing protein [Candidatus Saccharimonadales bacterium]|nr:DUF4352 domain-containing protein [Candidatus Saccharimonadales bacterium]